MSRMSPERKIDDQAVEAAEFFRKNDQLQAAIQAVEIGLGIPARPLTEKDLAIICLDPQQTAIVACLARIHVDSLKSLANRSTWPPAILERLESAADTIENLYANPQFQKAMSGINVDHRGRQHHFSAEMGRDIAKTAQAAAVLYGSQGETLISYGEIILQKTYDQLPEDHPVKPLIGIELLLSRMNRDQRIEINQLKEDFAKLCQTDIGVNPHRVATVASWLIVAGEKTNNKEIQELGNQVFQGILERHPEWNFMIPKEQQKVKKAATRNLLVGFLAPLTTPEQRRESLPRKLTSV